MTGQARFLSELDTRAIDGPRPNLLLADFSFYSAVHRRVFTVPAGYKTDYASVPWYFRWYINTNKVARKPAVIHDFGCDHPEIWGLTQKEVDGLFNEGAQVEKIRPTLRLAMYGGIRAYQSAKGAFKMVLGMNKDAHD